MQKIFWIVLTFIFCYILKLGHIWAGFAPVMLCLTMFKFGKNIIWEIPLAVLCCDVLLLAFADDVKLFLQILILCSTAVFSIVQPRRILILFAVVLPAVIFENTYWISAVWATLWCSVRNVLCYFTTKQRDLQEYKL